MVFQTLLQACLKVVHWPHFKGKPRKTHNTFDPLYRLQNGLLSYRGCGCTAIVCITTISWKKILFSTLLKTFAILMSFLALIILIYLEYRKERMIIFYKVWLSVMCLLIKMAYESSLFINKAREWIWMVSKVTNLR